MASTRRRAWCSPARSRPASRSRRRWSSRRDRPRCSWNGSAWWTAQPLLLEQVHLPADRFPGLLASDLEHDSLYRILTERYDTHIVRARETFEPVLLLSREAALLARDPGTPALMVEGIAYTADGVPVEFGRTYVRGDRTRYYVERSVVVRSGQGRTRHAQRELVAAGRQGRT